MDFIGSQPFIGLEGDIDGLGTMVENITRASLDGNAFRQLGRHSAETTLNGIVDCTSMVHADSILAAYKHLQGQVVNLTIRGLVYQNFLVVEVGNFERKQCGLSRGGVFGGNVLLRSSWRICYVGTA